MTGSYYGSALALGLCFCICSAALSEARSKGESEYGGSGEFNEQQSFGARGSSSGASGLGESQFGAEQVGIGSSESSSGFKGATQSQTESHKQQDTGLVPAFPVPGAGNSKGDLAPMFNLSEYAQLIFSPFELVKKISDSFKLPQEKFIEKLGKGLVFGAEALLTPMVASFKIIEKVFVPDQCRLKFVCHIGSKFNFVKDTLSKLSPNVLSGSFHLKALTDGVTGQNCETLFKDCEPRLKKPYEDLKSTSQIQ